MNDAILQILLQKNLDFLATLVNACMTWWVSAVVFCGSLIAGIWLKQDSIRKMGSWCFHWFFFVSNVFVASVVCFGFWVVLTSSRLESEHNQIIGLLKAGTGLHVEFAVLRVGMILGTSSFVLILFTIIGLWIYFSLDRTRQTHNKAN